MPICPKCGNHNPQLAAQCPRDDAYFIHEDAIELAETDPRIGTMAADKYVIVGRISKGGMGAVYRAIQLPVEREVAFKVLRTEMEDSDSGRDRFIREARAVSRLTHPNIITLHDFGFEKTGHPYMVMEYAPGKDMGAWLREEPLTIERIVHVIRQLLSALDQAHREGIVHRDLKPENMIITTTGSDPDYVKLLDFGIARMINETSTRGLTREGEVFGTPHYMAPEQAQGAKEVGPPADVYAVGIMLYELITGEPPYDAGTPLAVLMMHLNEPLPTIHPRPGVSLPPSFIDLILRSVDKDPTKRFVDAGDMLRAIDGWMAHSGIFSTGTFRSPFHTPTTARPDPSGEYSRETLPGAGGQQPNVNLQGFGGGVAVEDPDPSQIYAIDNLASADEPDPYDAPSGSKNKAAFAILGVLVALIVVLGGGIAYAVLGDKPAKDGTEDPEVAEKTEKETPEEKDGKSATNSESGLNTAMKDPEVKETTEPVNETTPTDPTTNNETSPTDTAGNETSTKDPIEEKKVEEKKPEKKPERVEKKPEKKPEEAKKPEKKPEEKKVEEKKPEKKPADEKWGLPTVEERKENIKDDKW
ncbi:MAG: serine/threonine-protein kinase [Myxococcota bacterium]|jgi:serine/threonine protein kinase|nr:serine/threonine-protein kinase [Myxococcota bacterium]